MKRRALLVGAAGVSLLLAGCAGDGGDRTDTDETTTGTPTTTATPSDPRLVEQALSPKTVDDCPPEGRASVEYVPAGAAVVGCLWGANGCHVPRLASATYDEESDVATLVVQAAEERRPDEACTQALVSLGYEARLRFEYGLPGAVVVVHDDVNGRRRVARLDFDEA